MTVQPPGCAATRRSPSLRWFRYWQVMTTPPFPTPSSLVVLRPTRDKWVVTLAGLCDAVWHLTEEEQVYVTGILGVILDRYSIPGRSDPAELPQSLMMELQGSYWTTQLTSHTDVGLVRPVRPAASGQSYPLEVWRAALLNQITVAYPDIEQDPMELLGITADLTELLAAIGVPDRAPSYLPEEVVRAARSV